MKDQRTGVIIGRFQPLHLGHAWLIKKSLEKFDKVLILIGSSNVDDDSNPWSFDRRKEMLDEFIKGEKLESRIIKIDRIEDVPDDDKWLEIALKKIGGDDFTAIGDNEWVNGIFEKAGYKVWRVGFFNRDEYEGVKIRNLIKDNKNWESKVPEYIVKLVKN